MSRYSVGVPLYVYFEVEAKTAKEIYDMSFEELENIAFEQLSKWLTVDLRDANFDSVTVMGKVDD
jgi:hypothetical protein